MRNEINWGEMVPVETKERFETVVLERIVWDAIKKIEDEGYNIGEGKTAQICILEEYPEACLKAISQKSISCNRSNKELEFLDLATKHKIPVPRPICSVETNDKKDYLFMERINGFSIEDLVKLDLINHLPENFNYNEFIDKLRNTVKDMNKANIYHRDLHWGNVMIDSNGDPIIIDFGDAIENRFSNDNPYIVNKDKNEGVVYTPDDLNINRIRLKLGLYLKNKGYFEK